MKYILKSGVLYDEKYNKLNSIKNKLGSNERTILNKENEVLLSVFLNIKDGLQNQEGDSRRHNYIITNNKKDIVLSAIPHYRDFEDDELINWPLAFLPKTDRLTFKLNSEDVELRMHNEGCYSLLGKDNVVILSINHRGIVGGWNIDCLKNISSEIVSAIFCLCRCLESENEFNIV